MPPGVAIKATGVAEERSRRLEEMIREDQMAVEETLARLPGTASSKDRQARKGKKDQI